MENEIFKILDTTGLEELEKQRVVSGVMRVIKFKGRAEHVRSFVDYFNAQNYEGIDEDFIIQYLNYNEVE